MTSPKMVESPVGDDVNQNNLGSGDGVKQSLVDGKDGGSTAPSTSGENGTIGLKRELGFLNGVSVIIGCIIGAGIFVSPGGVLKYSGGSPGICLIVWATGGFVSMLGSYCYAELGTSINQSGADYAYIMEAFGPFPAFMRLWVEMVVIRPSLIAIIASSFSIYVVKPFYVDCDPPRDATLCLALFCILILAAVNCYSVAWTTRVQDACSYVKVLALFVIIVSGIVQLARGEFKALEDPWKHEGLDFKSLSLAMYEGSVGPPACSYVKVLALFVIIVSGIVQLARGEFKALEDPWKHEGLDFKSLSLAMYEGLFAYNGWNFLNYVIEELKDPVRNLPRAIFVGLTTCIIIYILTNVAYFTTLTPDEIMSSRVVGLLFAQRLFGKMWWIMPIFVVFSTFGTVNGILFTSSRLTFVGARHGHLPVAFNMVSLKRNTPIPSVLFIALLSSGILIFNSDISQLITFCSIVVWLAVGAAVLGQIVMRFTRPDLYRPLKIWLGFPILYVFLTFVITICASIAQPYEAMVGLCITLTCMPVYLFGVIYKHKPMGVIKIIAKISVAQQKLFHLVAEEKQK